MTQQTLALVGAVGGAGTTRTTVECAGVLAAAGHDVAILDAAFATQGLGDYVPGQLETDLTRVVTEDAGLEAALVPLTTELRGAVDAAPARAPFERVARAKTAGAADRFERAVAAAGLTYDAVLVDTPPVAANQAVAAVNACERVALVAPATRRGADGVARMTGVLEDLGAGVDATVATARGSGDALPDATARLPESAVTDPADCPSAVRGDETLARASAEVIEATLSLDLSDSLQDDSGGLRSFLPGRG